MTNWCYQLLKLRRAPGGKDGDVAAAKAGLVHDFPEVTETAGGKTRVHKAWTSQLSMETFMPMPDGYGSNDPDAEVNYHKNGLKWCSAHWGTKWDFCAQDRFPKEWRGNTIHFQNPWQVATPFWTAYSVAHPGVMFNIDFTVEGHPDDFGTARFVAGMATKETVVEPTSAALKRVALKRCMWIVGEPVDDTDDNETEEDDDADAAPRSAKRTRV